jgi:hypothetical protein
MRRQLPDPRGRLACVFGPFLAVAVPLMAFYAPVVSVPNSTVAGWQSLRKAIRAHASIELAEDFDKGLWRWAGRRGQPQNWVSDTASFVHPGQLAIYIKSVPLTDYRLEFLGLIERQSLGFVYRAMDFDNYYAARITIVKPGPLPEVILERYVVIGGRCGPRTQVKLPFAVRMDTLYAVQVSAHSDHFMTRINDHFVDAFSDDRLHVGGVGFFSGVGESARVGRLRITDRDDLFGKICSVLVPHFGD